MDAGAAGADNVVGPDVSVTATENAAPQTSVTRQPGHGITGASHTRSCRACCGS